MPIAVISEVREGTLDMYDAVNRQLEADGLIAQDGHIFHCAGAMEGGGFRVFDVWETQQQFERFREEALVPAINAVAGDQTGPPNLTIYELHNVIAQEDR